MMIAVASFKGGVGKTTTAVHIAGAIRRSRGSVLLVDGDPNYSASRWATRGPGFPFQVSDERTAKKLPNLVNDFDHAVFDTEAHPTIQDLRILSQRCAWIVVPSIPDAISLDATILMGEQLAAAGVANWKVLLTICPRGKAAEEARTELQRRSIHVFRHEIPRFVAFQKAHLEGVLVHEVSDKHAGDSWDAYRTITKELF